MKTKAKALFLVAVVAATVGGHALSQPADTQPSAKIDPYSGLPTGPGLTVSNSTTKSINPATGLPQANGGDLAPLLQAQAFTASGQYEQALQCFLRLDAQARATTNNVLLKTALPDWIKLGKKYPAARQALIDIWDLDTREFTQGRSDLQLFQKVADINEVLGDDAATVDLFKSLRQTQPSKTREWFFYVEPALVRRGEYQLCLECIGNPETRFNIYCYTLKRSYQSAAFMAERSNESRRRALEILQQPGRPSVPKYLLRTNHADDIALHAITNLFAGEVSCLVEILVHTGHQELADKIRGQAAAVLDGLHPPASISGAEETAKAPKKLPLAGAAEVVCDTPSIIAPPNQFFGPVIELPLRENENGLSDGLNLDFGTVVSRRELKSEANFYHAELPEEGIAIFTPRQISPLYVAPLSLLSKGASFIYGGNPNDQRNQQAWNAALPPAWLTLPRSQSQDSYLFQDQKQVPGLPALFGFQTSRGNAGLLQITGLSDNPRGVTVRYKLLKNPNPPAHLSVSPEDWSPALAPGEKPNLKKIRSELTKLVSKQRYEEALERLVWCYNHALQCGDTETNPGLFSEFRSE